MQRMEFILKIKPACLASERLHGIPWGWLVAQAIQESGGYGLSDLSVNAHNLYGIKGHDYYQGATGYAKFATWDEAILFQGWQLSQSRYAPFKPLAVAGKYKEYGDMISRAGWCPVSSPTYGTMIAQIATEYNLFPKPKLSEAQQWAIDNGIINEPTDWTKVVDYNTVAWLLFKSRGKI
jgi:hypothetical protein